MYVVEEFPPNPWRRRLLVLVLAVGTAAAIVLTLLAPPGGSKHKPPPPADVGRCAQGQTQDCVGGTATVIVAPAASAPR